MPGVRPHRAEYPAERMAGVRPRPRCGQVESDWIHDSAAAAGWYRSCRTSCLKSRFVNHEPIRPATRPNPRLRQVAPRGLRAAPAGGFDGVRVQTSLARGAGGLGGCHHPSRAARPDAGRPPWAVAARGQGRGVLARLPPGRANRSRPAPSRRRSTPRSPRSARCSAGTSAPTPGPGTPGSST